MHGITWHEELSDKTAAVNAATYFAIKRCDGSENKLKELLDNKPEHYKGNHTECSFEARCQQKEESYESSKCSMNDPTAIELLTKVIRKDTSGLCCLC